MTVNVNPEPELSVVVVNTRDSSGSLRRTLRYLHRQSARRRIELLLVAPSAETLRDVAGELNGFHAVRIVETAVSTRGRAAAEAMQIAQAPLIALLENHSFPDPGWAEALIRAHGGPWACVGPVVRNANPGTFTSRANFLLSYGHWAEPADGGERNLLPFHNSAYKRKILEPYGDTLKTLLDAEGELQADLVKRGARLYLEPAAATSHVNEAHLGTSLRLLFCVARVFGATRCRTWSGLRRAAYVAGAPLIPLVSLPEWIRHARRTPEGRDRFLRLLPLILLHGAALGAGEVAGYLVGEGHARRFINMHEFVVEGRDVQGLRHSLVA